MRKHLSKIAIVLTICMCLPLFAACDMNSLIGAMQQPSGGSTEAKDEKDETKAPVIQDDELPEGLELALGVDGNSYRVANYNGSDENVEIPAIHNGFPVTEIDEKAFFGKKEIVSVVIPDSIEIIGESAFKNCTSLEYVTIGEYESMLYEIGKQAFQGCSLLAAIEFVGDEDTWEDIEKGKDWDKNAGAKSENRSYEIVFIAPSEPPVETEPEYSEPEYTDVFGSETEEISTPTVETGTPDNGECKHEKITVPGVAPTCTEKGYLEGIMCAKCGIMLSVQMEIPALGHMWDAGTTNTNASCGETADVVYKCKTCGETRIETGEVVEHVWYEYAYTEPTCEVDGLASYRCARYGCSETKTEIIDAIGHEWGEGILNIAPTCCNAGIMEYYCTRSGCGVTKNESIAIDPDVHSEVTIPAQAPTCTDTGLTAGIGCASCGKVINEGEIVAIDPDAHKIVGWTVNEDLQCYEGNCIYCDKLETRELLYAVESGYYPQQANRSCVTVTQEDGFVRYAVTSDDNYADVYFYPYYNGTEITGRYVIIKYRLFNNGKDASNRTFYIASLASGVNSAVHQASKGVTTSGKFIGDGEWHYYVVSIDPSKSTCYTANDDGTYSMRYLRFGFNPATYDGTCYMDIDELIFSDDVEMIENYVSQNETKPTYVANLDGAYCKVDETQVLGTAVRGNNAPINLDLSSTTLSTATSLTLGGWVCTSGGVATYKYRVVSVDGVSVESPELLNWIDEPVNRADVANVIGTPLGYSEACGNGAGFPGKVVDLSGYEGKTVNVEVVAITNYGAEIVIANVTNITIK